MSGAAPTLSVVLPAFRAADLIARHVPPLRAHLDARKVAHEIVVADDGSDDGGETRRIAEQLGLGYVAHDRNRGKGAAVRLGMARARGRFRFYTDADVPYEFDTFDRFLYYLEKKEFHIVAGDRNLAGSSYFAEVGPLRRAASHAYSFVVGRFVAGGWFDTQCGMKGFRAAVAEDLFAVSRVDRFAIDVELLYVALQRNYDIKRLPVRLRCQEGSSVRVLRDGIVAVADLGRIGLHQALGHYAPRAALDLGLDDWKR